MNSMNEEAIKISSSIFLYEELYVYVPSVCIEINEMEKVNLILNRLHSQNSFMSFLFMPFSKFPLFLPSMYM